MLHRLDYKASVYCEDNFYSPACDVKCVDHDDTSGHYTCDVKSGQKVCLDGEYPPFYNIHCISVLILMTNIYNSLPVAIFKT